MRQTLIALALAAAALSPAIAQASVRMHVPHGRHHKHKGDAPPAADAPVPTSDIPDAVWTPSKSPR